MVSLSPACERWLNPFWFPSETKARFGLVILAATCLTLFAAQRGLEVLGYSVLAWIWLILILLPAVWRLAVQSVRVLRRRLNLVPVEFVSSTLAKVITGLTQDPWFSLDLPPRIWVTSHDCSPLSFGLGRRKHILLPQCLLDYYKPNERGVSAELKAILGHELAHVKNGDLCLKGLADIVFHAARDSLLLWLLPVVLWTVFGSRREPVLSIWEILYLALALPGCLYLYRTALRWRELYADARLTLSLGTGESLEAGLETVEKVLRYLPGIDRMVARLSLPGLGVAGVDRRFARIRQWLPAHSCLARLEVLFRAYPTDEERTDALANPNRLFCALDIPLVLLCGFLPTFVVGLAAGLLPRSAVEVSLQAGLVHVVPRWAKLVAKGQTDAYALLTAIRPTLVEAATTPLVTALESAVSIALALYLLTAVLGVHLVYHRRGVMASLKISGAFVAGMLLAQLSQPTMLGLLLAQAGPASVTLGLGLAQSLVGVLSLGLAVNFYLYLSGRLLQRYPAPPNFLFHMRNITIAFEVVLILEALVALPLTTTLDMLPTIACVKALKWGAAAVGVLWGMQVRRRYCPACRMTWLEDGETSAVSGLCCNSCGTMVYAGWSQPEVPRHWSPSMKIVPNWILLLRDMLGQAQDQVFGWARSVRAWIWPHIPTVASRPPIVYGLVALHIIGGMVLGLLLLLMLLGALAAVMIPDFDPSTSPEMAVVMVPLLVWFILLTCLLTAILIRHTLCGCPWVYFANLALAILWSLTILLAPVSLAVILCLRRERAQRYFYVVASDRPVVVDVLTAVYAGIGFVLLAIVSGSIAVAAWMLLAPEVVIAMEPAAADRTFRVGIRAFCIALYFIGLIIACAATAGALVRGRRWAYLVTLLLSGCGVVTLALAPLGFLSLVALLSSRTRRYFNRDVAPLRPLAVEVMLASGLVATLIGSRYLSTHLVPTTLLALLAPQRYDDGWEPLEAIVWRLLNQSGSTVAWGILVALVLALTQGNRLRRRWAYVLNLSVPVALASAGLWCLLTSLMVALSPPGESAKGVPPSVRAGPENAIMYGLDALIMLFLTAVAIVAAVRLLRSDVRGYFGIPTDKPVIVDLVSMVLGSAGVLLGLLLVFIASLGASLVVAPAVVESTVEASILREIGVNSVLIALNLGDFAVVPLFVLAVAVWHGNRWAHATSLVLGIGASLTLVATPVSIPVLLAWVRPAVRRYFGLTETGERALQSE